jgi:hypothetical protein
MESFNGAQADLELVILLPLPPECWDYRCVPPSLVALNLKVHYGLPFLAKKK